MEFILKANISVLHHSPRRPRAWRDGTLCKSILFESNIWWQRESGRATTYRRHASEHRRCRSCWEWPSSSRWRRPAGVRGCRAVERRCRRFQTNRSGDDRWWLRASATQRSRTIRWLRPAGDRGDRSPWSHRDDRWSKCTFAAKKKAKSWDVRNGRDDWSARSIWYWKSIIAAQRWKAARV